MGARIPGGRLLERITRRIEPRPGPAHSMTGASGSPGANRSDGVAVTVTHRSPVGSHSRSVTTPVQFVTDTNDG